MKRLVAETLARWAVDLRPEALPADVLTKAEDVIIDANACALAGSRTDGAQRVHSVARSTLFGEGDAILWFDTATLHPTAAAFANSASASMLDLDDGHRNALGHPGAAIVPAVLAFADSDQKGIDVLANIVAAYEVCIRVGCSEHQRPITRVTGQG